ncbi:MAG: hypothetical protein Q4C78_02780 [Synergistaceae bacterium]|nr:hypothetical protein [Synergistaceae bacterium]
MIDLVALWQNAKENDFVCSKNKITKRNVLALITNGANNLREVKKNINFSCDGSCAAKNPSGRSCDENIEALLEIYVPLFELMKHTHSKA